MSYAVDFSSSSSQQIEQALCERLEQIRLSQNITQERLATEAGVSVRTLRNLEKGEGVSFDTAIRVMIALGVQQALESLLPDPSIRPVERIEPRATERKRASPNKEAPKPQWSWADGGDDDE